MKVTGSKIFVSFFSVRIVIFDFYLTHFPILYPLKTPENRSFSVVFRWYEIWTLGRNRLNKLNLFILPALEKWFFVFSQYFLSIWYQWTFKQLLVWFVSYKSFDVWHYCPIIKTMMKIMSGETCLHLLP